MSSLKVRGLAGNIVEVEYDVEVDRWKDVGHRAGHQLGYHGTFSFRLPDGKVMAGTDNLVDSEDLAMLEPDAVVDIVEVGT